MKKKQDVPNARDEIRKLQEALARKGEYPSSADEFMANKGRGALQQDGNEPKDAEPDDKDEQTANNFAARKPTQANTKS